MPVMSLVVLWGCWPACLAASVLLPTSRLCCGVVERWMTLLSFGGWHVCWPDFVPVSALEQICGVWFVVLLPSGCFRRADSKSLSRPLSVQGCMVSSCGTSGLFSSVSAPGVCLVPCQLCRTIVCLSYKLPCASPRALLLGGSYSSGLVACRCLAPACHAWLVEVCLCMTLSCKDFLL